MLQYGGDLRCLTTLILLAISAWPHSFGHAVLPSARAAATGQHALLVGCTQYPNSPSIPELWGPANDVPAVADLLKKRFGFPEQNIRRLVGWPDDPASRPTCANIVSAFEDLCKTAQPNSQIVILMTGHGTQTPIPQSQQHVLDPSNPERDGLDEVFLPADFKGWTENGLENAIIDDQLGVWLDELRDRGAAVWIIFDCCHSGTMTKDAQIVERHRGVKPQLVGVPDSALRAAADRIGVTAERNRGHIAAEADVLGLDAARPGTGSVTAFYAAQAFETAPELPRPSGASRTPENYFGLLTYLLIQALESQEESMTYRDLGRRVIARYRAERGSKSPTPFFGGDLDREVLGLSAFPERTSIVLERAGRTTRASGGEFQGITPGTILAVFPPNDRTREESAVLGYVTVISVTADSSIVESCEYEGSPTTPLADLPDLARCTVVWQDLGDMRLKLAVTDAESAKDGAVAARLTAAIEALPQEIAALVNHVGDAEDADWQLLAVEPDEARSRFGLQLQGSTALLIKAGEGSGPGTANDAKQSVVMRRVFGQYPVDTPNAMAQRIQVDLQKLFSWQNTWRIAGLAAGERLRTDNSTLKLEVSRVGDSSLSEDNGSPGRTCFVPGDDLRVRIVNDGTQDLWVTLLYLDANFGIAVWFSEALKAGNSFTDGGTVDGSSSGPEGFIVLAVPVRSQKSQPAYEFLEQEGLGVITRDVRRLPTRALNPFEQLMSAAAFGKGRHRGLRRKVSSTPQILSWSWVTLPVANPD